MTWPHPIGSVVLGRAQCGLPVRPDCDEHLFEIVSEAQPVDYACGFIQRARCLVHGYVTPPIDADWWRDEAEPGDFQRCQDAIVEEANRLLEAGELIARIARGARPVMEDFG